MDILSREEESNTKNPWMKFLTVIRLIQPELLENIKVSATDDKIVFEGSSADLDECYNQLSRNMLVPERIVANLNYTLATGEGLQESDLAAELQGEPKEIIEVYAPPISPKAPSAGEGLATIEQLFGQILHIQQGIQINWQDILHEQGDAPILVSKTPLNAIEQSIWQAYINAITERMAAMPLAMHRNCYIGNGQFSMVDSVPESDLFHTLDIELIHKILGFTQIEEETYLYCDFVLLHKIFFPPLVTRCEVSENEDSEPEESKNIEEQRGGKAVMAEATE